MFPDGDHVWRNAACAYVPLSSRVGAGRHLLLHRQPVGAQAPIVGRPDRCAEEGLRRCTLSQAIRFDAIVVLPDHLHCVWRLPEGDADNADRWKRIKTGFSRQLPSSEYVSSVRRSRGERGIWQRRYWEHLIRDEQDLCRHIDYVHINPFKHGLVNRVADWPYSSFHRYVRLGGLPIDWAGDARVGF